MVFGAGLSTDVVRRRGDEGGRFSWVSSVRLLVTVELGAASQVQPRTRIWASSTAPLPTADLFPSAVSRT